MNDSQLQKKKPKMFLRKKETKPAPLKAQAPLHKKNKEVVVFENTVKHISLRKWLSAFKARIFTHQKKTYKKKKPIKTKQKGRNYYKQFETDFQLALIPLILMAILSLVMHVNNHYMAIIAQSSVSQVESAATIQPFPLTENVIPPDISAKAALALDVDSQVVIVSKNSDLRFSMASTTKVMTALTALDHFKDTDILTVRSSGIAGSVIGLQQGEQLTFSDLLYAMLLPSANDAAVAIADNYPGGQDAFIKKMNEKALLLHLTNTHFADASGLNDDENFTTAYDLARLGLFAMKNQKIASVVSTQQKTIYNTYFTKVYPLTNLNKLLGTYGVDGIKTGTTEGAGEVLLTSAVINGHRFIIVVMNSKDRFADTVELIQFIQAKVQYYVPPLP